MKAIGSFLSKTLKGGIFFGIPLALTLVLAGKAMQFVTPLAEFVSVKIIRPGPDDYDPRYIVSILLLVFICFLFGLVGGSVAGKRITHWLETNVLGLMPGYAFLRSSLEAAAGLESMHHMPVRLVPIDGWMLAFEVERLPNDELVMFVPGSPDTTSGNVVIFKESDTRATTITQQDALRLLKHTGIGMKGIVNKQPAC